MLVCTIIDQMRSKIRCHDDDCRNFHHCDDGLRHTMGISDTMGENKQGADCTPSMSSGMTE